MPPNYLKSIPPFILNKELVVKKLFFFLIVFILSSIFSSCELFEGVAYINADNPDIEYIGRFDFTNSKSVKFDWSGVQIRTRFMGTSCSIRLKDGNNDYNIIIDGKLQKVLRTNSDTIYVLATNLENKSHTLLISKRTEAKFGIATFEGFIIDGGKYLTKISGNHRRKIEFIGDSYLVGFGSEGTSPDCKFSRETENCYISFGPQLARRLNSDYTIVAASGIGVVKNHGDSISTSEFPMPYYYDRVCMNDTLTWDFKKWQPDVVVVRLGRNDYWQKPHPKRELFRTSYINFLKRIRSNYPNATIFALCGPIRKDPHCDYIRSAVNELNGKKGHKKIQFIKLEIQFDVNRDFGCEKHPNKYGHQKITDFLEPIVRKEMKWESALKKIIPSKTNIKR